MSQQLFVHTARPEWGHAILASEGQDRRHYQFEDGQVRTISERFYSLLEPVHPDEAAARKSMRKLRTLLKHSDIGENGATTSTRVEATTTFGDQIAMFRSALPEGFADKRYVESYRGGDARRKRAHIDPSIEDVKEKLSLENFEAWEEAGDWNEALKGVIAPLMSTDLMSTSERKAMNAIGEEHAEAMVAAVKGLVHGTNPFGQRYKVYVDTLEAAGVRATWAIATALPALADPEVHVCVRATAFREQARSLLPKIKLEMTPELGLYELLQQMTMDARDQLREAGLSPKDLFDVRNFMWLTLRKDADRKLREM